MTQTLNKRAQPSGAGAAVLITIIAALIVLYILLLPPESRERLLEGNESGEEGNETGLATGNLTLLIESPGRLDYLTQKEIEHTLPPINLFTRKKAVVLESRQSIYVKNAWFDRIFYNISFSIDDIKNTENVKLVFNVKKASGRLILKLNGEEIYNSEITTSYIEPIELPKKLLKESNYIEVIVSSVGWKFWKTNEYELEGIKIAADVTDISAREAKVVFQVSEAEKKNLDRVYLKFFPECNVREVDPLEIFLNNNKIFSSVPDCGILRSMELSPHYLLADENILQFKTNKGTYLIDNLIVKSELKELVYPTYYFEINSTLYEKIINEKVNAVLYMDFIDDIAQKKAEISVNRHKFGLDTKNMNYSRVINQYVREGNNVIEIKPLKAFDVLELRVVLENR
ncbi:MAG: hypothetical protein N3D84_00555 [Candidatus Woesearchaeota archaeon]|nr:hypothetical protein [Candidatus Woesearchaeota archaeon]